MRGFGSMPRDACGQVEGSPARSDLTDRRTWSQVEVEPKPRVASDLHAIPLDRVVGRSQLENHDGDDDR
jgi:hypothetical protein